MPICACNALINPLEGTAYNCVYSDVGAELPAESRADTATIAILSPAAIAKRTFILLSVYMIA